ncbi:hypothetical protein CYMTET_28325 [Cymbomonas tetramitiformis]|uniref:Uncharacterized protein n=1 Tax=Cymbomonas tetramitiformis TaxID=36881 RepID=A0AAE0FNL0_9CHLO|nr:hypothetical protein CYMTET_28325 [Cymbomonas tetramitiformis]
MIVPNASSAVSRPWRYTGGISLRELQKPSAKVLLATTISCWSVFLVWYSTYQPVYDLTEEGILLETSIISSSAGEKHRGLGQEASFGRLLGKYMRNGKPSQSVEALPASISAPQVHVPEFLFGGEWRATKSEAKKYLREPPMPACHAGTLLQLPGGHVLVSWFGGLDEGTEDVAIYVATRYPSTAKRLGYWGSPRLAAKVHRNVPYGGRSPKPLVPPAGGEPHWNPVLFCAGDEAYETGLCETTILLFFKVVFLLIPEQ